MAEWTTAKSTPNWNWDWAVVVVDFVETSSPTDSVAVNRNDSPASDCCTPFVRFDSVHRTVGSFVDLVCDSRCRCCCHESYSAVGPASYVAVGPLACFAALDSWTVGWVASMDWRLLVDLSVVP